MTEFLTCGVTCARQSISGAVNSRRGSAAGPGRIATEAPGPPAPLHEITCIENFCTTRRVSDSPRSSHTSTQKGFPEVFGGLFGVLTLSIEFHLRTSSSKLSEMLSPIRAEASIYSPPF